MDIVADLHRSHFNDSFINVYRRRHSQRLRPEENTLKNITNNDKDFTLPLNQKISSNAFIG